MSYFLAVHVKSEGARLSDGIPYQRMMVVPAVSHRIQDGILFTLNEESDVVAEFKTWDCYMTGNSRAKAVANLLDAQVTPDEAPEVES